MAELDRQKIKKLKRGELVGTIATVFCGLVLAYFTVLFSISIAQSDQPLQTLVWATAPALMIVGIAVSAFCNLKYGVAIDREIDRYVMQVFVDNAAAMHPERTSLSFFIALNGNAVELTVNGYKEKIVFDFSAFGKLSLARKATVLNVISGRLNSTFCRLYERGVHFTSVDYREKSGTRRKSGRTVPVIVDGVPDKTAMKLYRKNR